MQIQNKYYYFKSALSSEQCQKIIDIGVNKITTEATIHGINHNVRDSEVSWFDDSWLYDLLHPYLQIANDKAGWRYELDLSEKIQFTKYNKGGFYDWHADGNSCHFGKYNKYNTNNPNFINKIRKLSMTVNLNKPEDYDGGNLQFDSVPEVEEIRAQGSIIIFPSYIYHQVTPVTRGTRYSLVMWALGEPFK